MDIQSEKRARFREIFSIHLRQVKGRLLLGVLCTMGVAATELFKPWPLKIILDHIVLKRKLPDHLKFLFAEVNTNKTDFLVAVACSILVIAVIGGLLSYLQIFITSSVGYKMVYALRRELFAHLQCLSLSFHNRARSGDLLTRIRRYFAAV